MDVIWLQRDLGLYLNGFVDTHFASEALGYPQRSLAFLLKKFADFDADKKYQLADWRIRWVAPSPSMDSTDFFRPLPEEMFFYARSDTHFLLYIFDMVRNELVEKSDRSSPETDLIGRVLRKSRELALNRYEHPTCNAEEGTGSRGWYNIILKQPQALSGEQFAVFRRVWKWRDEVARRTDESTPFVLPQQAVWDIALVLPPDQKALHSLIPRHAWQARSEIQGLWKVVQAARAEGQSGPTLQQFLTGGAKLASGEKGAASAGVQLEDAEVPLRPRSHLFGGEAISSRWEGTQVKRADDYVQLPWQRLYAEKGIDLAVRGQSAEETRPAEEPVPEAPKAEPEEDNEFTLKAGRKRKRMGDAEMKMVTDVEEEEAGELEKAEEAEDRGMAVESSSDEEGESTSPGETTSDQTSAPEAFTEEEAARRYAATKKKKDKAQRKEAVNKANKKAAKKEAKKKGKKEEEGGEEEPFDYSQAKSVMHAKREGGDPARAAKRFDPFVKGEGVKGARKAPPIRGTRSATFRK